MNTPTRHPSDRPAPAEPAGVAKAIASRAGKLRTALLLWLLGVPIPIILLILLIRGCMG